MHKLIKANEAVVRQIANNKFASNYITKDLTQEFSLATTEGVDYYEKEMTEYSRIYYVLEGKLVITVESDVLELSKDDACYLEAGTTYGMRGTFKAIVVNKPAFGSLST